MNGMADRGARLIGKFSARFCALGGHWSLGFDMIPLWKSGFSPFKQVETSCSFACFDQTVLHEYQTWPCGERERDRVGLEKSKGAMTWTCSLVPKPKKRHCSHSLYTCHWQKEELFHFHKLFLQGRNKGILITFLIWFIIKPEEEKWIAAVQTKFKKNTRVSN